MPAYHVVITGHLDEWKLPPDGSLPKEIHQVYNYDVDSLAKLGREIDDRQADICGSGAMKVRRDPFKIKVGVLEPSIIVPLHMITHLSFKVTLMTGEMPILKNDEIVLKSGKDVVKH